MALRWNMASTKARRVTPELLTDLVRVTDPRISPDAGVVAYVRVPSAKSGEHPTSEIWSVGSDGSNDRRLTTGNGQDLCPRWSPNGRYLAFTSDRSDPEKPQLYVMDTRGGEGRRITTRKTAVSDLAWSADSSRIAFLSKDEPTEQEGKDKEARRDAVPEGEILKRSRLYVVEAEGGKPVQVSPKGEWNIWSFCWSPDGDRIAAASTPSPLIGDRRNPNDLVVFRVARDKKPSRKVVVTFPSAMSAPRWSPDRRVIAFLATEGRVQTVDQIFLLNMEDNQFRQAVPGYEGSVLDMVWKSDDTLLFSAQENLYGAINSLDLASGSISPLLTLMDRDRGSFGESVSLADDGTVVITRADSTHAPDVFRLPENKSLRRLTTNYRQVNSVRFRTAKQVSWQSNGLEIFGFWTQPRSSSPPYPTVLLIHGGPASAFSDRFMANWHDWTQLLAANGFAVLMPNPRGSTGRGAAFVDAEVNDIGGLELQDDMAGLDLMIEQGLADPDRLAIAGWSHGGYMAAWTVTQTARFKAAVMGAGVSNMISDQGTNDIPGFNLDYFYDDYKSLYSDPGKLWDRSPLKYITNVSTPTLVLHGENDDRVAASQGREFYRALKLLDIPAQMVIYPRETHRVVEREHQIDLQQRVVAWLKEWV